ncbi:MAG: ABC transporter permease subunit [Planctomycetota bacterium]|nr:ABC transporter permease subunit [Planctomycetota bacterium]
MANFKNIMTICCHDLLDQVRDRRTLFMIIILPLVLYPLAGELIVNLAVGQQLRPKNITVINPPFALDNAASQFNSKLLATFASQLAAVPTFNSSPVVTAGVMAFILNGQAQAPPLFVIENEKLRIGPEYLKDDALALLANWDQKSLDASVLLDPQMLEQAAQKLISDGADAVLVFPEKFAQRVEQGETVPIVLFLNEKDDSIKLMEGQLRALISRWGAKLRSARFLAIGLTVEPDSSKTGAGHPRNSIQKEITGAIKRILPLMLVMWALVGALYPAIDLCAGEKERGTMETLLISAASRQEIVFGKFLAIWTFSTATALLNIITMGLTATHLAMTYMNIGVFNPLLLFWAVLLLLPLGAFFSALSLAIGAYARSSREGQYYLMPLVMMTLPLVLITLAPGTKLDLPTCFIPITGISILLQELMDGSNYDLKHMVYLILVLSATASYAYLALQWAVRQFSREEVLFREAEQFHWPSIFKSFLPARKTLSGVGTAVIAYFLVLLFMHLPKEYWGRMRVDPAVAGIIPIGLLLLFWMKNPGKLIVLKAPSWAGILIAMSVGFALIPVMAQLSLLDGKAEVFKNLFDQLQKGNLGAQGSVSLGPIAILSFLILPLIVNEVVFRGFLLGNIKTSTGMVEACGMTALLFAAQSFQPIRFLPDLVSGFFFALLVLRFNSLWVAIVAHLASALPALVGFLSLSGLQGFAVDFQSMQNAWWLYGMMTAFAVLILLASAVFLIWPEILLVRINKIKTQIQAGSLSD